MSGFRLAGLLRIRGIEEDIAESRLSQTNRALHANTERAHHVRESAGAMHLPVLATPTMLLAAHTVRSAAIGQLSQLAAAEAMLVAEQQQAEAEYRTAKTNHTVLDKLGIRHAEQAAAEELRAEQAALDEIATTRAATQTGDI